jgi:diguanylate cyclase (GGDEF)-like protein
MDGLFVTVSLGVATYPSPPADYVNTVFREADYALYRAKQNGRNWVEIADNNASVASTK